MKESSVHQQHVNLYCNKENLNDYAKKKTRIIWWIGLAIILVISITFWIQLSQDTSDDPLGGLVGGALGIYLTLIFVPIGLILIALFRAIIKYAVKKSLEEKCEKNPTKFPTIVKKEKRWSFNPFSRRKIQFR